MQQRKLAFVWCAACLKIRVLPERDRALIETEKQGFVRPFEVQHHVDRIANAYVLPLLSTKIEDKPLRGSDRPVRQFFDLHIAVLNRREIIRSRPFLGRVFIAERVFARLETFHSGRGISEDLNANFVEIPTTDIQGMIRAPPVIVADICNRPSHIDFAQDIRPRAHERFRLALIETRPGFFKPLFGERIRAASKADHIAARCGFSKVVFDPEWPKQFHAVDVARHNIAVFCDTLLKNEVEAELEILSGHLGAIVERDIFAQVEDHPILALGIFHRGAKIAVKPVGIVCSGGQDVLKHQTDTCEFRDTFAGKGIEAVKVALRRNADVAAFRGVRVYIIKMREIRVVINNCAEIAVGMGNGYVFVALTKGRCRETSQNKKSGTPSNDLPFDLSASV